MPFNAIANCAKVTLQHDFRGQECINDFWFLKSAGSITFLDLDGLAVAFGTRWGANVMPLLSSDLSLLSVTVRDYTVPNGLEVVEASGAGPGGAGDAFPNNVAACVSLRTGFAGRHYRGRIYLGGIPRTAVAENSYIPDFVNGIITALGPFVGVGGVSPGWQLVVVAQWQVLTPHATPVPIPGGIVTPVQQFLFTDDVVDSQRRRLPGRGK